MTEFLHNWIKGLAAAALFSSVMLTLTPKGNVKQIVKLVCGALLTFVLLSPLTKVNFDSLSEFIARTKLEGREISSTSEYETQLLMKLIIEEETQAYILDKALKLGIEDLKVKVTAKTGDKYPYPYSAELSTGTKGSLREELTSYIEGELGIPRERQSWDNTDGN
jgi:stage III sporulation protein AF